MTSLNLARLKAYHHAGWLQGTRLRKVFIYTWLLYLLYCLVYGRASNAVGLMTFALGAALLAAIYKCLKDDLYLDEETALLVLLAITLPLSFRSILGSGFNDLPVPWFYVLLFTMLARQITKRAVRLTLWNGLMIILPVLLLIPLAVSEQLVEGFKEYLGYASFLAGCVAAAAFRIKLKKRELSIALAMYLNGALFVAMGIVFQYVMYNFFGIETFSVLHFANNRNLLVFLFYDMSGNTIYLGTAVILYLFSSRKFRGLLLGAFVFIAMALTSARTGVFSLALALALMIIFEKRQNFNKVYFLIVLAVLGSVSLGVLLSTRVYLQDNLLQRLFFDNGRIDLTITALQNFADSPLFGKGLDYAAQMKATGTMAPHFALVNMLAQTGFIITSLFSLLLFAVWKQAKTKPDFRLKWVFLLCIIGSCFSPGFFDLRFFTVVCMFCIAANRPGFGHEALCYGHGLREERF